jgi:hypothetical protein
MMKHVAWAVLLSLGLTTAAAAQTAGAPQNPVKRQLRVAQRVAQGIRQGQLTRAEVRRLRANVQTVRAHMRALRQAGGSATPDQRTALRQELRRLNRLIFTLRHNGARRS